MSEPTIWPADAGRDLSLAYLGRALSLWNDGADWHLALHLGFDESEGDYVLVVDVTAADGRNYHREFAAEVCIASGDLRQSFLSDAPFLLKRCPFPSEPAAKF